MIDSGAQRIALGTAQFGMEYGIANTTGKVAEQDVAAILDFAADSGVECLDTAYAYQESEKVIGRSLKQLGQNFSIVSKLSGTEDMTASQAERIFEESLERLQVDSLYGYLAHRSQDLLSNQDIWKSLLKLKTDGRVNSVGVSVYCPEEIDALEEAGINVDLVQLPFSLFDRRFESRLPSLKEKGVEIHARSVFLQGLVFLEPQKVPDNLSQARPVVSRLRQTADNTGLSIGEVCLNFVLLNNIIDRVVIGVDSLEQLRCNLKALEKQDAVAAISEDLKDLRLDYERLLVPFLWGKS